MSSETPFYTFLQNDTPMFLPSSSKVNLFPWGPDQAGVVDEQVIQTLYTSFCDGNYGTLPWIPLFYILTDVIAATGRSIFIRQSHHATYQPMFNQTIFIILKATKGICFINFVEILKIY